MGREGALEHVLAALVVGGGLLFLASGVSAFVSLGIDGDDLEGMAYLAVGGVMLLKGISRMNRTAGPTADEAS